MRISTLGKLEVPSAISSTHFHREIEDQLGLVEGIEERSVGGDGDHSRGEDYA